MLEGPSKRECSPCVILQEQVCLVELYNWMSRAWSLDGFANHSKIQSTLFGVGNTGCDVLNSVLKESILSQ